MGWSAELGGVILLSIIYLTWTHLSYFSLPKPMAASLPARLQSRSRNRYRSSSPQVSKTREGRRPTVTFNTFPIRKDDFGYVWMTVPKNYR